MPQMRWTVTEYLLAGGDAPVLTFLEGLAGDAKAEAIALVRLLEERGNTLREPVSKSLGQGLFELRGRASGVRIFYTFRPGRVVVLLDGMVKKRGDIPGRELARLRLEQDLVALREDEGISQRELARRVGVSQPVIARIEAGRARNLELRTLLRIASALNGEVHIRIRRRPGLARRAAKRRSSPSRPPA